MLNFFRTCKQLTSPGGIEGFVAIKYAEFAKDSPLMRDSYKNLATKATAEIKTGKVLEVGSGPGFLTIEMVLLAPELQVFGLDISDTMIETALNNAREYGISERIEFKRGDASKMPFEDSQFDFVISSGSLHHWKEPKKVFNEIHRVLKAGKKALVSDLRRDSPKEQVDVLAKTIDSGFMRWGLRKSFGEGYIAREIENLIKDTQFTDCKFDVEDISLNIWLTK
jgi:ubiquinone/menaquinone biosynthesis C-methylase UbiE